MALRDALSASCQTSARAVWGQAVDYAYAAGGSDTLTDAVMDEIWIEVLLDGVPNSRLAPILDVRLDSMSSPPKQGDVYETNSVEYKVTDVQPDAHGGARLISIRV